MISLPGKFTRRRFVRTAGGVLVAASTLPALSRASVVTLNGIVFKPNGSVMNASVGSSGAPSYLSSLADFTAYAATSVSNSKPHWRDAASAEWQADPAISLGASGTQTDHLRQIVDFSGGGYDVSRRLLYTHGGGHAGSAYNAWLVYDANGASQPGGWSVVGSSESTVANVTPNSPTGYADGKPPASQSYDNLWVDETNNQLYRTLGFAYGGNALSSPQTWKWDGSTGAHTQMATHPDSGSAAGNLCYDPTARKALQEYQGRTPNFYRMDTDTWVAATDSDPNPGPTLEIGSFYDASRSKWYIFGGQVSGPYGTRRSIATINWSTERITWSQFTASGDSCPILTEVGASGFHDTFLDCYWIFGGRYTAFDHIYRVNPSTWAITAHQLKDTGGSNYTLPEPTSGSVWFGTYKRILPMVDWRVVAVVLGHNQPVHFIKLPST